jgi:uncharacterized membrane protein
VYSNAFEETLMMTATTDRRFWAGWAASLGMALLLVALATLPPFVGEEVRAAVMQALAPFCHQLPAYSPHIGGVQLAVGHRMYGILWGLAGGVIAFPSLRRWDDALDKHAALVLGAAATPMTLDWALHAVGWWTKTPVSRWGTGALFGMVAGYFLARAVVNLFASPSADEANPTHPPLNAT